MLIDSIAKIAPFITPFWRDAYKASSHNIYHAIVSGDTNVTKANVLSISNRAKDNKTLNVHNRVMCKNNSKHKDRVSLSKKPKYIDRAKDAHKPNGENRVMLMKFTL